MLGSSSCSQHHQQQNQELHSQSDLFQPPPPPPAVSGQLSLPLPLPLPLPLLLPLQLHHHQIPPSIHLRQLLLTCAHSISQTDFTTAHRITTILLANSSPSGDSSERLIHSFTKALALRLRLHPTRTLSINNNESWKQPLAEIQDKDTNMAQYPSDHTEASCTGFACQNNDESLQSSYFSLNQITPFIRFSHLTANQAILEAIQQQFSQDVHILDFDIMHGFQWPPLMQAIADRHPPLTLRITATGSNLNHLRRTGDRLSKFAHSLNLTFQFFPLLLPHNHHHHTVDDVIRHLSAVVHLPNETLAVNCIHYLHRMLTNRDKLCLLLKKIKSMNPKVVTLAENESNHNHPVFISRFKESLHYYTAVFDSLEATLPPNSRERMEVEQVWFGREIADIVAAEGEDRRVRHERFLSWEMIMRLAGFRNVGLSSFNVTQAKLLLRLHYPCEGYNLEVVNDCFFLGWQNQPLFSVSSWH